MILDAAGTRGGIFGVLVLVPMCCHSNRWLSAGAQRGIRQADSTVSRERQDLKTLLCKEPWQTMMAV